MILRGSLRFFTITDLKVAVFLRLCFPAYLGLTLEFIKNKITVGVHVPPPSMYHLNLLAEYTAKASFLLIDLSRITVDVLIRRKFSHHNRLWPAPYLKRITVAVLVRKFGAKITAANYGGCPCTKITVDVLVLRKFQFLTN